MLVPRALSITIFHSATLRDRLFFPILLRKKGVPLLGWLFGTKLIPRAITDLGVGAVET
jgi:hypothetical protein